MLWVALFFFVLFLLRVAIDPRAMRAGVYLLLALICAALDVLWVVFGLALTVGDDVAVWVILALLAVAVVVVLVLGVALILNGVTMLRREGRRPANALSLGVGVLLLAEVAWSVVAITVPSGSGVMVVWAAVVVMPTAYVGVGFVAYVLYSALYQVGTRLFARPVRTIVVLGSGLINGRVPPLLASRLDRGQRLMERSAAHGKEPVVVVAGGKGDDESRSEAAAMAEYLIRQGVASDRIFLEDRSRTTQENIANVKALMAEQGLTGRIGVVTNNFHAFRSALLLRQAKVKGYVVGAPTARYYWPSASIREFIAIIRDHPWFTIVVLALTWLPVLIMALVTTF